jgi:hypothetical protein
MPSRMLRRASMLEKDRILVRSLAEIVKVSERSAEREAWETEFY